MIRYCAPPFALRTKTERTTRTRVTPDPLLAPLDGPTWLPVRDGDARLCALYARHYSARHYRDGRPRRLVVGPGEKLPLLTPDGRAIFIWRRFKDDSGQTGVNCAAFRNEGPHRSSDLIRAACEFAWRRWPGERLYTYVAATKIASPNPGYCFKAAGWRFCGKTKGGLHILEVTPDPRDCPLPVGRQGAVSLGRECDDVPAGAPAGPATGGDRSRHGRPEPAAGRSDRPGRAQPGGSVPGRNGGARSPASPGPGAVAAGEKGAPAGSACESHRATERSDAADGSTPLAASPLFHEEGTPDGN